MGHHGRVRAGERPGGAQQSDAGGTEAGRKVLCHGATCSAGGPERGHLSSRADRSVEDDVKEAKDSVEEQIIWAGWRSARILS